MSLLERIRKDKKAIVEQEQRELAKLNDAYRKAERELQDLKQKRARYVTTCRNWGINKDGSTRFYLFLEMLIKRREAILNGNVNISSITQLIKNYKLEALSSWLNEMLPEGLTSPVSDEEMRTAQEKLKDAKSVLSPTEKTTKAKVEPSTSKKGTPSRTVDKKTGIVRTVDKDGKINYIYPKRKNVKSVKRHG